MDSFENSENMELFLQKNVPTHKIWQFEANSNFLKPLSEYQFKDIIL